jgi:hypothetical protein
MTRGGPRWLPSRPDGDASIPLAQGVVLYPPDVYSRRTCGNHQHMAGMRGGGTWSSASGRKKRRRVSLDAMGAHRLRRLCGGRASRRLGPWTALSGSARHSIFLIMERDRFRASRVASRDRVYADHHHQKSYRSTDRPPVRPGRPGGELWVQEGYRLGVLAQRGLHIVL